MLYKILFQKVFIDFFRTGMQALTRAFQRTKERPRISMGTQKPKRWPPFLDLLAESLDISHSREKGVFSGPRNGRISGNAQNKKHCSLANGRALHNTSGGTPFSCCTCPNTAHKIRTIQTLHTKRFSNPGWWPDNTRQFTSLLRTY